MQTALSASPGVSVAALLDAHPSLPVDVVWAMLTSQRIFTDLSACDLMNWDQVRLYLLAEQVEQAKFTLKLAEGVRQLSTPLLFDGRLWEVEIQNTSVLLRPEAGAPLTLPTEQFEHLLELGYIQQADLATPSPLQDAVRERLIHAGPKELEAANRRWREILAYVQGGPITVTTRSVQNWMADYRQAEADTGCGYVGLLDCVARRGNRTPRVPEASRALLEAYLTSHYAAPQGKRAAAVYRLYREEAIRQGIPPIGERTFYRERARFADQQVIAKRKGSRAAYASQPILFYLDRTTPRHGERPIARAHLDHTQLDIMLVSSVTGKPFAKPWATFMTDAYSRRILACYVTYDPPSYRSAMMAFRLCVQRYGRLPQELVVDRGPEFGSVYFESLLARCFVTKLERPPQQPHFGSVIERLFGVTTTELLNQLRGNTLEQFAQRLSQYAYDVYDQMDHPALGQSPREAFEQGMLRAGGRTNRFIPYSEAFLIQTRPSTRTGVVKIHRARGITVNGLQYWHDCMRSTQVAGQTVPVRYEPYDMGVVYAYIGGQWIECVSDAFAQVHGRSEREWHLILEEWREHQRQHEHKRITLNGPLLAQFLREIEHAEALLLQRQRDLEEQAQRSALLLRAPPTVVPKDAPPPVELDLTKIPQYEEYV